MSKKKQGVVKVVECLKMLVEGGADVDATGHKGLTPLLLAVKNGETECLQVLMDLGADVHAVCPDGSTAVLLAAAQGHFECLQVLLQAGANAWLPRHSGFAPLDVARDGKHWRCVELLEAAKNACILCSATHSSFKCAGCFAPYCSWACKESHWEEHKQICQVGLAPMGREVNVQLLLCL